MSGLEIAGVVLGAMPLVIEALEFYAEGVRTAKRFWRFTSEIRSTALQINTERGIFINTLEQLLTGIVEVEHMAEFLEEPGGRAWREAKIEVRLKDRLRSVYGIYMQNVMGMEEALGRMMEKLALGPDGKVRGRSFPSAAYDVHGITGMVYTIRLPCLGSTSNLHFAPLVVQYPK